MKLNKMREEMIQSFIDCLKKDTIPWHRSWSANERPFNAVTNTAYHGANSLWLSYNQFEEILKIQDGVRLNRHSQKDGKLNLGQKEQRLSFGLCMTQKKKEN